jgi:hypothetical protein
VSTAWRRRVVRVISAVAVVAGALVAASSVTGAQAARIVPGNDYSWPQCPVGVGNGEGAPLPWGTHRFAVVGLTNGTGLHENPCLASEWRYARSHATYVTGYVIVTYPTRAQRIAADTGHYGPCSTYECRLRNNGWAQADFTDASLRRIGAHPPLVWIDIEPRYTQPWTTSRRWNSMVIRATIAGLQSHGYAVGIYSNRRMWHLIAGFRTTLREWVPAGSLSYGCSLSFGGPVWLSQDLTTYSGGRSFDEDGPCRRAPAFGRWFQHAHPTVTTAIDATTGIALTRFDGGRALSLQAPTTDPPSVVAVSTPAGSVPLFAAARPGSGVWVRTLSSWWRSLPQADCASAPSLAASGRTLYVGCTAADGAQTITTVRLTSSGVPTGTPTVTSYDPTPSPSPSPSPSVVPALVRTTSAYLR